MRRSVTNELSLNKELEDKITNTARTTRERPNWLPLSTIAAKLIEEAKRAISISSSEGTVEFFEINEANIQKIKDMGNRIYTEQHN